VSPTWDEIDDLILDVDGHLWERYRGGYLWLGPIEDVDAAAGRHRAYAELLDRWRDAFDPRAEAEAAWRLSCE
jgi:hypothetical protein